MNKHFEDAVYYLGRAGEHVKAGVLEELEPAEHRLRELTGREIEEESPDGRIDRIRAELRAVERRAEGESKRAVRSARERLGEYRGGSVE